MASWASECAKGWWLPAVSEKPGNVYLYATRSSDYTGNGCGKTHLAWAAFKRVARLTAAGNMQDGPTETPVLTCDFVDLQAVASEFRRRLEDSDGVKVWYNYSLPNGSRKGGTFDEYLADLARMPFLVIDDIGVGGYFGKNDNPTLAATVFEKITDLRASNSLPTLYTSNYSPEELGDRVGSRAASRIFRPGCATLRIRAPDYAMSQCSIAAPRKFKMASALTRGQSVTADSREGGAPVQDQT